ncbi:MAG: hypothetical protein AAF960_29895 [Bacteroidota bacterium]
MDMATFGDIAFAKGSIKEANEFYNKAFKLEYEAALEFPKELDARTKFIWLRSAAALAYRAGFFQKSRALIEVCRSENPPNWIERELQDILELIAKAEFEKD